MNTTTPLAGRIDEDLLELFEQPPAPHEPDVGTVEPFTDHERAAIAKYNDRMRGLDDMFDVIDAAELHLQQGDPGAGVHRGMQYAHCLLVALNDWYEVLDELHSGIAEYATMSGAPSHSNAAIRLLSHEADQLLITADTVRFSIVTWLLGIAGPHENGLGGLSMSNGWIART
jgi:hypothetical protein